MLPTFMTIGKRPFGISSGGVWLIQSRRMMSTPSFAPNLTLIPPLWELIQGLVRLLNGIYESLSFRLNVLPFGTRIWRGSERGDTKHRCVPLPQSNGLCHTGKNPWRLGQKEGFASAFFELPNSFVRCGSSSLILAWLPLWGTKRWTTT